MVLCTEALFQKEASVPGWREAYFCIGSFSFRIQPSEGLSVFTKGYSIFCHLLNCQVSGGVSAERQKARVSLVWPLSWPWWSQRTALSLSFLTCKMGSSGSSLRSPLAESVASHLTRSRFPGLCCHQHSGEGPKAEFVNPSTSWTYLFSLLEAKYKKKKGS